MAYRDWSPEKKTAFGFGVAILLLASTGLITYHSIRLYTGILDEQIKTDNVLKALDGTVGTLSEAVADHHLVIGTSRHLARRRRNVHAPRETAERIVPLLSENRIALVFGREVNGLEREDLALCHELIAIPSSDAFPSLNLSHAVMVIAYELFLAAHTGLSAVERSLAPSEDLEQFFEHLQKALRDIGFLDGQNAEHMMSSLRQLFGRARLEPRDVSILRGILAAITDIHKPKDT